MKKKVYLFVIIFVIGLLFWIILFKFVETFETTPTLPFYNHEDNFLIIVNTVSANHGLVKFSSVNLNNVEKELCFSNSSVELIYHNLTKENILTDSRIVVQTDFCVNQTSKNIRFDGYRNTVLISLGE